MDDRTMKPLFLHSMARNWDPDPRYGPCCFLGGLADDQTHRVADEVGILADDLYILVRQVENGLWSQVPR